MNVSIEPRKCIAAGMCVNQAPAVFDQDEEDGSVILLDDHPGEEQADSVRSAAELCPAQVITLQS